MADGTVFPLHPSAAEVEAIRAELVDAGYKPVEIINHDADHAGAGKAPIRPGWQHGPALGPVDRDALNTGILCDGLRAIDIDIDNLTIGHAVRSLAMDMLGEAPMRYRDNSPRVLFLYRAAEGSPGKRVVASKQFGKVEVLGRGQQFVAYGVHPSRVALRWLPEGPATWTADALPAVTEDQIDAFLAEAGRILGADKPASTAGNRAASPLGQAAPVFDVVNALNAIPNNGPPDWEAWNKIGMATWGATDGSEIGRGAWHEWSKRHPAYDEAATEARWQHYRTSPPGAGAGTLFAIAKENGWKRERPKAPPPHDTADPGDAGADPGQAKGERKAKAKPDSSDLELTEDGVAIRFAAQHGHELRFCHDARRWFHWKGTHWQENRDHLAFSWARELVRALNRTAEFKTKAITGKTAFAAGVERFAQADRAFAVTAEVWDTDPWLLGTPGGTVDLRTGQMRPAKQSEFITKIAAVAPAAPGAACDAWLRFLDEATGRDDELIRFLQQWCGYCLTGATEEHALLFVYGPGGNGKSVFVNTLAGILAEYARTAAMDTFTASQHDKHTTDLAMLRGARVVTASETEQDRAWAEARIKQMTGGDPITARFTHRDNFTFRPAFKLTIAGNHKPVLKVVDAAARRRFNIVPFTRTPADPDPKLEEKLRAEWPAILRWMIDGCLDWQAHRLVRPEVVKLATADYFEEQDVFGVWAADCCTMDKTQTLQTRPSKLLESFAEWAQENGERAATRTQLRGWIERQPHLRYKRVNGSDYVAGIAINVPRKGNPGAEGADGGGRDR